MVSMTQVQWSLAPIQICPHDDLLLLYMLSFKIV